MGNTSKGILKTCDYCTFQGTESNVGAHIRNFHFGGKS